MGYAAMLNSAELEAELLQAQLDLDKAKSKVHEHTKRVGRLDVGTV